VDALESLVDFLESVQEALESVEDALESVQVALESVQDALEGIEGLKNSDRPMAISIVHDFDRLIMSTVTYGASRNLQRDIVASRLAFTNFLMLTLI